MSKPDLDQLPSSGNFMDLLQDEAWMSAALEAEDLVEGCITVNSFQKRGWMKTWPELPTHSHYRRMQALVGRGFAAMLQEICTGAAYEAASACGKPLIFQRLFEPGDAIKAKLLAAVEGEKLGPPPEMTPERLATVRSVLKEVLTAEDWAQIAQAASAQIEKQMMALAA